MILVCYSYFELSVYILSCLEEQYTEKITICLNLNWLLSWFHKEALFCLLFMGHRGRDVLCNLMEKCRSAPEYIDQAIFGIMIVCCFLTSIMCFVEQQLCAAVL